MTSVLQRVGAGEPAAVQDCIDRFGGLVWSLARRLCPPGADPEDAVQEIFLSLWKGAAQFDPDKGDEATFVAVIARRRLIDMRRKLARHTDSSELPEVLESQEESHVERTAICDDAERARQALEQLRPEQRRVLEMSVYGGLSHQQISSRTEIPLGTVKTHARRGLMRLRELMGVGAAETAKGATP